MRAISSATVVEVEGPSGREASCPADLVFLMTGYHPDLDLLSAAGVAVDQACGARPSTIQRR